MVVQRYEVNAYGKRISQLRFHTDGLNGQNNQGLQLIQKFKNYCNELLKGKWQAR